MEEMDDDKEECSREEKWKIEDAVNTLVRAEEIKSDAELMAKVKPLLSDKMKALKKVTSIKELRDIANKKAMEEDGD